MTLSSTSRPAVAQRADGPRCPTGKFYDRMASQLAPAWRPGQSYSEVITSISPRTPGAGDGNRTRVVSLESWVLLRV